MEQSQFVELVLKHFGFLLSEYGFVIENAHCSEGRYGSGFVQFLSDATVLRVEKDGTDVQVSITPAGEPEIARLYLPTILAALSIANEEDFQPLVAPQQLEALLEKYARHLRTGGREFLAGDYSHWPAVLEYHLAKRENEYSTWSGRKLHESVFRELKAYIKKQSE